MSLTKVSFSMINGAIFNVVDYGAVADGTTDATAAIQSAIDAASVNGGVVQLNAGTYKITDVLAIPDHVALIGQGKTVTTLKPIGTFDAAVLVQGTSFASWGTGRSVQNLEIDGSGGFTGDGLRVVNCGLRNYFADLYIHECTGVGLYVQSVFDHTYERIETRANSSYGIYLYEKQSGPDGVYEEVSKLIFNDCWAIANNSKGEQWRVAGGDNCAFVDCKPSEGTIGLNFSRNCFSHKVQRLMFDKPTTASAGTGIAIQTNANFVYDLFIDGLLTYKAKYGVNVVRGQNIFVDHVQMNDTGTSVYAESTADGAIYVGEAVDYADARTTPQTYPRNKNGAWTPTFNGTGSSLGDGTLTGRYVINGNVLTFSITLTIGSTTTVGSGAGFTLPTIPAFTMPFVGMAIDSSTGTHYTLQTYSTSSSVVVANGANYMSSTVPFTWATGDTLRITGAYFLTTPA